MRAKSAVIIRVASKFSSPAAGVRRRNLRTEAEIGRFDEPTIRRTHQRSSTGIDFVPPPPPP